MENDVNTLLNAKLTETCITSMNKLGKHIIRICEIEEGCPIDDLKRITICTEDDFSNYTEGRMTYKLAVYLDKQQIDIIPGLIDRMQNLSDSEFRDFYRAHKLGNKFNV